MWYYNFIFTHTLYRLFRSYLKYEQPLSLFFFFLILKLLFDAAFFSQPFSIFHDSFSEMGWLLIFFAFPSPNSLIVVVIVLSPSCICPYVTPRTETHQAPLFSTVFRSSFRFITTELVMLSIHLILCCPLLLLPSVFPSIRIFSHGSALHIRWPQYWSFSFSNNPSNEYSGLVSFRIEWFDLLALLGTLKSLLQHHNSKASVLLWHLGFFMVQLLNPYVTTRKTIALTIITPWLIHFSFLSVLFALVRFVFFIIRKSILLLFWPYLPHLALLEMECKLERLQMRLSLKMLMSSFVGNDSYFENAEGWILT